MTYGDGAGNAQPLTSIDVAGHEMSHGVTENTAGLIYTRRRGRPQRGDVRHLRHRRRVLRQQPARPGRLPHRREDQHQRQRHAAALHGQAEQGRRVTRTAGRPTLGARPALLLGPAEPLVLPGLRGQRRQDHQRRLLQQPHLRRLAPSPAPAATTSRRSGTARCPRSSRPAATTPARATAPSPRPSSCTARPAQPAPRSRRPSPPSRSRPAPSRGGTHPAAHRRQPAAEPAASSPAR